MKNKIVRTQLILIAACLSVFFEALDVSIVALALPSLKTALGSSVEKTEWLQTIYVLFYAGFLILGGRLADVAGRKNIYLIGSGLFLLSSLSAGFCSNIEQLIICRSVQGLGAAFAIPSAISIITNLYSSEREVNRALGIFGSFAALGFASGLMAGGVIVEMLNWKWIFWLNVPIIITVMLIASLLLPQSEEKNKKSNADVLGGFLITITIIVFTYAIHLASLNNERLNALLFLMISILLFVLFMKWEDRHVNPLINIRIFRDRYLRQMNFSGLMLGASFLSYVTFLSVYLQNVLERSSAFSGWFLFPFSICSALVARFFLPYIQRRTSVKFTAVLGYVFLGTGCLSLIAATLLNSFGLLIVSVFCVNAVAISIVYPSLTALSMQSAAKHDHGIIAGLQSTAYTAGCGIGIALIWSIVRLLHSQNNFSANAVITAMIVIFVFCSFAVLSLNKTHENTYSG